MKNKIIKINFHGEEDSILYKTDIKWAQIFYTKKKFIVKIGINSIRKIKEEIFLKEELAKEFIYKFLQEK